jgi:hypothetical protein
MKTKFTKASKNDKTLVTVSLKQFEKDDELTVIGYYSKGDELTLVVDNVPTVFIVNRLDNQGCCLTATTKGFPRHLRLPGVGRPVFAEVTEIR